MVGGFLSPCVCIDTGFVQLIPYRAFIGLWQVVRYFLARRKPLRVAVRNLDAAAKRRAIVSRDIVGIGWACCQGTGSAFHNLRPCLSSDAVKQIV
jgi:hypothetical protein